MRDKLRENKPSFFDREKSRKIEKLSLISFSFFGNEKLGLCITLNFLLYRYANGMQF